MKFELDDEKNTDDGPSECGKGLVEVLDWDMPPDDELEYEDPRMARKSYQQDISCNLINKSFLKENVALITQ